MYPVCFDDFSAVSPLRSAPIRAYTVRIRVPQRAAMTSTLPVFDDLIASDDLPALRVASGIEDCNRAAGALFGTNRVKLAVRRDAFLRGFALSFIELFAPEVDPRTLERLMHRQK